MHFYNIAQHGEIQEKFIKVAQTPKTTKKASLRTAPDRGSRSKTEKTHLLRTRLDGEQVISFNGFRSKGHIGLTLR